MGTVPLLGALLGALYAPDGPVRLPDIKSVDFSLVRSAPGQVPLPHDLRDPFGEAAPSRERVRALASPVVLTDLKDPFGPGPSRHTAAAAPPDLRDPFHGPGTCAEQLGDGLAVQRPQALRARCESPSTPRPAADLRDPFR